MPRSPRLPTTIRSASSESTWSRCRTGSSCSSSPGASSRAACTSTNGSRVATTKRSVAPCRSASSVAAASAAAEDCEPSTPTTIERGQVPDARGVRATSTEHGDSCRRCVVTEPSAIPTARLCPRVPTTASVASMRSSSARSASSGFPSTSRVSDSCNDSVRPAPRRPRAVHRPRAARPPAPYESRRGPRARGPRPRRRRASRPVRPLAPRPTRRRRRPANRPRRRGPARRPCRDLRRARPRPESARTRSRATETYRCGADDGPVAFDQISQKGARHDSRCPREPRGRSPPGPWPTSCGSTACSGLRPPRRSTPAGGGRPRDGRDAARADHVRAGPRVDRLRLPRRARHGLRLALEMGHDSRARRHRRRLRAAVARRRRADRRRLPARQLLGRARCASRARLLCGAGLSPAAPRRGLRGGAGAAPSRRRGRPRDAYRVGSGSGRGGRSPPWPLSGCSA